MTNVQEWLDRNYPHETRESITELDLSMITNSEGELEYLEGELDLRDFTNLKELYFFNTDITALDVSHCPKLKEIYCYANKLTELKLGNHPNLESIYCGANKLTSLDLSSCPKLEIIHCYINELTSLDISNCSELRELWCGINPLGDNLIIRDQPKLLKIFCEKNELTQLDLTGCPKVESIDCRDNSLTDLDVSECYELENLHCGMNQIDNLNLGDISNLKSLVVAYNRLASIETSKLSQLLLLDVSKNRLTGSLNLELNPFLFEVYCWGNELTELDVSKNIQICDLFCNQNELSELKTDNLVNLESIYCSSNQLVSLDLTNCSKLEILHCNGNNLTSLDLSACLVLEDLCCNSNEIKYIKFNDPKKLIELDCSSNEIKSLELGSCPSLKLLNLSHNQLSELELKDLTDILEIRISKNKSLNSLNISGVTPQLTLLSFQSNNLKELNLENLLAENLINLNLSNNKIEKLTLNEKNNKLQNLFCQNNNLKDFDFLKNADPVKLLKLKLDIVDNELELEELERFTELEVLDDRLTSKIWKNYQQLKKHHQRKCYEINMMENLADELKNNLNTLLTQRDDLYLQLAQFNTQLENLTGQNTYWQSQDDQLRATILNKNEEINKIKEGISVKEFQKKVLKKRPWFRGLDINIDPDPLYWENLKNQLTEPLSKELVDAVKELGEQVIEYDERIDQILQVLGYEESYPVFEGLEYSDTPGTIHYWTELEKKFVLSRREDGSQRKLEDLINIVVNVKKHLGLSDTELDSLTTTTNLAMPTKEVNGVETKLTLKELIDFYNSFPPEEKNPEKVLDEANRYQKLNVADNNDIRERGEIDQTKINHLKKAAKAELELAKVKGLFKQQKETSDNEKKQLQTELEELKTTSSQTITYLKKENKNLKNNSKITQEAIFRNFEESFKELEISVPESTLQLIKSANSVEDIEKFRKGIIIKELTKNKKDIKNSHYLNVLLGVLFLASLLILTGIVIKQRNLVRKLKSE